MNVNTFRDAETGVYYTTDRDAPQLVPALAFRDDLERQIYAAEFTRVLGKNGMTNIGPDDPDGEGAIEVAELARNAGLRAVAWHRRVWR